MGESRLAHVNSSVGPWLLNGGDMIVSLAKNCVQML